MNELRSHAVVDRVLGAMVPRLGVRSTATLVGSNYWLNQIPRLLPTSTKREHFRIVQPIGFHRSLQCQTGRSDRVEQVAERNVADPDTAPYTIAQSGRIGGPSVSR